MSARTGINQVDCNLSFQCGQILTEVDLNNILVMAKSGYNRGDSVVSAGGLIGPGGKNWPVMGYTDGDDLEGILTDQRHFENPGYNKYVFNIRFRLFDPFFAQTTNRILVYYDDKKGLTSLIWDSDTGSYKDGVERTLCITGTIPAASLPPPGSSEIHFITMSWTLSPGTGTVNFPALTYYGVKEYYLKLYGECP